MEVLRTENSFVDYEPGDDNPGPVLCELSPEYVYAGRGVQESRSI